MKKLFFLLLFAAYSLAGKTQTKKTDSVVIKNPSLVKKMVTANELKGNSSTNTQQKNSGTGNSPGTQAIDNTQYFITGAVVTIKTGNDSKEYPSKVQVYLFPPAASTYSFTYTLGQLNLTNAMNVNTNTEIGLTPLNRQKIPWPVYYAPGYNGTNKTSNPYTSGSHNWMLSDVQRQGLRLLVAYKPNIALDAWEIKQVTVKLKIESADGTPHPTLNNKTIVFNISTPMLGVPTGMALVCEADKDFAPTTNYLTKDILID